MRIFLQTTEPLLSDSVILRQPYSRGQLEQLLAASQYSEVSALVAIRWDHLLGFDEASLEECLSMQITGCSKGLTDMQVRLIGSAGDLLLFRVCGDPSALLANYESMTEHEAAFRRGDILYGVNVPVVAALASEQLVAAGLHLRPGDRGLLRQRPDSGGIGLSTDGTQFLDGTSVQDLRPNERWAVQETIWQIIEQHIDQERSNG